MLNRVQGQILIGFSGDLPNPAAGKVRKSEPKMSKVIFLRMGT